MPIAPVSYTKYITDLEVKEIEIKMLKEHVMLLQDALRREREENNCEVKNVALAEESELQENATYLQDCIKRQAETIKRLDEEADRNTKRQSATIQSQNETIQKLLKEKVILQDDFQRVQDNLGKTQDDLKTQGHLLENQAETIRKNLNQISDLQSAVQAWKGRFTDADESRVNLVHQLKNAQEINLSRDTKIDEQLKEINRLKEQKTATTRVVSDLTTEINGLKRDAERYRWLRVQHWTTGNLCVVKHPKKSVKLGHECPFGSLLDDAIDYYLLPAANPAPVVDTPAPEEYDPERFFSC